MKRINGLISDIRTKFDDNFFENYEASLADHQKNNCYQFYDNALMILDAESWTILKAKAIEHFKNHRQGQTKQGFFNVLNEAFGYRYLLDNGFKDIRFMAEGAEQTPDISFIDRKKNYCEVKTIGISDDEIKRRSYVSKTPDETIDSRLTDIYEPTVYFKLTDEFLNKLQNTIDLAWDKIHSVGAKGIVFVLVRFDDFSADYRDTYQMQLTDFAQNRTDVVINELTSHSTAVMVDRCGR